MKWTAAVRALPLTTGKSHPSIASPWQALIPPAPLVLWMATLAATPPISGDYHSTFSS